MNHLMPTCDHHKSNLVAVGRKIWLGAVAVSESPARNQSDV